MPSFNNIGPPETEWRAFENQKNKGLGMEGWLVALLTVILIFWFSTARHSVSDRQSCCNLAYLLISIAFFCDEAIKIDYLLEFRNGQLTSGWLPGLSGIRNSGPGPQGKWWLTGVLGSVGWSRISSRAARIYGKRRSATLSISQRNGTITLQIVCAQRIPTGSVSCTGLWQSM